jgi:hypothetical protein
MTTTTQNRIQLNPNFLRAALITAGFKDVRYYLNGVLLDITPDFVRVVSTDGHRITVFHCARPATDEPYAPAQIIIPRETLKGIKAAKYCNFVELVYDAAKPLEECRIENTSAGTLLFKPIERRFPDYSRIFGGCQTYTAGPCEFNRAYLADADAVIKEAKSASKRDTFCRPDIYSQSAAVAFVTCQDVPEYFGAIMPLRCDTPEFKAPAWLSADRQNVHQIQQAA